MAGVEGKHGPGGWCVPCTGHGVAEVSMSQGNRGALCAEDALEGQLKWAQAGVFRDPQCRECCCGATGADAGIG